MVRIQFGVEDDFDAETRVSIQNLSLYLVCWTDCMSTVIQIGLVQHEFYPPSIWIMVSMDYWFIVLGNKHALQYRQKAKSSSSLGVSSTVLRFSRPCSNYRRVTRNQLREAAQVIHCVWSL
jgi:hypothetical protein